MTFVLGLTGSIATGKSTILGFFKEAGIPIYSADQAVHELYAGEAVAAVGALLPEAIVNHRVDRQILARIIVANPQKLPELEAIVHPLVHKKALDFIAKNQKINSKIIVLEIPLLFEKPKAYPLDAIAVTWCEDEIQKQRALQRPGMTEEKLTTILAHQMPQEMKKSRADFLINTGTSLAQTRSQVEAIVQECAQRAENRAKSEAKNDS